MGVRSLLRNGVLAAATAVVAAVGIVPAQAAGSGLSPSGPGRTLATRALNPTPHVHLMPTRPFARSIGLSSRAAAAINLAYNGGPVMQAGTKTIPVFWEPSHLQDGTGVAVDPSYNSLIQRFLEDVGGHGLYNILTQYYQVTGSSTEYIVNSSGFLQAVVDTSPYPAATGACAVNGITNCITDAQLSTKIASIINAGSLPKNYSTMYIAFTDPMEASCLDSSNCFDPDFVSGAFTYCAYHGAFLLGGQPVIYANMPYIDSSLISSLLCGGGAFAPNGNSDFDDETSPLSHEFMEAVTDPNAAGDGWYDLNYGEIGDICVADAAVVSWGTHDYVVQTEYSNAASACVPGGNNQISLSATSGAAGSSTVVTGTGFTPSHSVSLSFSDAAGAVTSLGTTNSNGSGAISKAVGIPGGATSGFGTLDATGASPDDGASAGFSVGGTLSTFTLSVSKAGPGGGTVTSDTGGINCGATCAAELASGTFVALTATPDASSTFTGWSGAGCSGTGPCQVSMTQARSVTATFGISYRPDGLLSRGIGAFVGNNVYNLTGAGQTRSASILRGRTSTFHWTVQNDGSAPDQMVLSASGSSTGFTARFFSGTVNITAAVLAGTYSRSLAAGASVTITVRIKVAASATIGAKRSEVLSATSVNSALGDVVLAKVTAR